MIWNEGNDCTKPLSYITYVCNNSRTLTTDRFTVWSHFPVFQVVLGIKINNLYKSENQHRKRELVMDLLNLVKNVTS